MTKTKTVAALTLGCKVNYYDTEAILKTFSEKGYTIVGFSEIADVYIINTCTVTKISDKKSRQMIRRARHNNPSAIVCVTGCYAQVNPEAVKAIDGVDIISGTSDRAGLVDMVEKTLNEREKPLEPVVSVSDISKSILFEPLNIDTMANRCRAFVKIQEGCDMFCSYCIIPYARGRVRSRPVKDIINEVKRLAENGYKEIVLTGIHVASYGKDLTDKTPLTDVIKVCNDIDGILRIRLSSMEPGAIDETFIKAVEPLEKLCPHFHLSLQSGCDKTLKAMNRKYDTAAFLRAANLLKEHFSNISLTTDIIAGFPGETDEDFQVSKGFIEQIGFSMLHVFPYSPKEGTPAAKMAGQVADNVKTSRVNTLTTLSKKLQRDYMSRFIGVPISVLFEHSTDKGYSEGFSDNYIPVKLEAEGVENTVLTVVGESICGSDELVLICNKLVTKKCCKFQPGVLL